MIFSGLRMSRSRLSFPVPYRRSPTSRLPYSFFPAPYMLSTGIIRNLLCGSIFSALNTEPLLSPDQDLTISATYMPARTASPTPTSPHTPSHSSTGRPMVLEGEKKRALLRTLSQHTKHRQAKVQWHTA